MAPDDEGDDEARFGGPPSPDDRLWRHPSEVAGDLPRGYASETRLAPRERSRGAAVLVAAGLAGAALMLLVLVTTGSLNDGSSDLRAATSLQGVVTTVSPMSVVERLHQGVLAVRVERRGVVTTGSAVVLRTDGYLVTAATMASGADALAVVLPDGRQLPATVAGNDAGHGLSLLHIRAWHLQLPRVSSAPQLRRGDPTVAVGVAGDGESAIVTTGVVQGLDLSTPAESQSGGKTTVHGLLGLDREYPNAADGGGLFVADGTLVGLCLPAGTSADAGATTTTPSAATTRAVAYALPWATVARVTTPMLQRADAATVWFGAKGRPISAGEARRLDVDQATVLTSVAKESAAAEAGLRKGDVVLRVGGVHAPTLLDAERIADQVDPGQPIVVAYLRDGKLGRATIDADAATSTTPSISTAN